MSVPTLLTERLIIRPVEKRDHEALAKMRANEDVGNFTGGTRSSQDVWMTMLRSHGLWAMFGYGYWTAEHRQTGALIGEVGFADFKRDIKPDISGTPEAGWIIAPEAWGQGYASEAMKAAHDWLDEAHPSRSTCIINPDNGASIRVAEKLGYKDFALTDISGDPILVFERFSPGTRKG